MDKRFDYLDDKTVEELEKIKSETEQSLEFSMKIVNDKSNKENVSEAYNDIKYEREKLEYIEELLSSKLSRH